MLNLKSKLWQVILLPTLRLKEQESLNVCHKETKRPHLKITPYKPWLQTIGIISLDLSRFKSVKVVFNSISKSTYCPLESQVCCVHVKRKQITPKLYVYFLQPNCNNCTELAL